MLFQYAKKMDQALSNFTWMYSGMITKKADMEAVQDIEEEFAKLPTTYKINAHNSWKHIHISNLNFRYSNNKETLLQNITMDIKP